MSLRANSPTNDHGSTGVDRRQILQGAGLLAGLFSFPAGAAGKAFAGFTHSVASGNPKHESVILWTRYIGTDIYANRLKVEVAEDANFSRMVLRGEAVAHIENDYCAQVMPSDLKPGRWYHYRFIAPNGEMSPVGRTRTLPKGRLDNFRIAVMSCSNATSGWFNAYGHAALRDDIDLVVHLGDYIYESPVGRSDALAALAEARDIRPAGEAVQLADYRLRYASYRNDPDLQELHRQFPMINIWDDHETANNSWQSGAKNHGSDEGPWKVRAATGLKAFREWLPVGPRDYEGYQIGDLATLFRLETRNLARSKQLDFEEYLRGRTDLAAAVQQFKAGPLADPARTMMGSAQEKWLAAGLKSSTSSDTRWQLLAQQVIMSPTSLPQITGSWFADGQIPSGKPGREIDIAGALAKAGLPLGLDRWDGYPAARERLHSAAAQARANLVTLSGDSHNAWAYDMQHNGEPVGVELCVQGVSSLGIDKRFSGKPSDIAADFVATNADLRWCDTSQRGYMTVELRRDALRSEWLFFNSRHERSRILVGRHDMESARKTNVLLA